MKKFTLLLITILAARTALALTVTNFTGSYRNGQVFFTWTLDAGAGSVYKLYRSSTPITKGSQLAGCEYLGYTHRNSSTNGNLTNHDGITKYWIIQTGGSCLTSNQGLFVTTCVANASYFYALTVTLSNVEDTAIIVGSNSLALSIAESVASPLPVLQETRTISGQPVEIYGDFISSRVTQNGPLQMTAGWLGYDFAVYRNSTAASPHPLHIRFHAGGNDFLNKITNATHGEVNLGVEDYYPDLDNSGWLGAHENYDVYSVNANVPPTSGTIYFYTQDRLIREIKWVEANCAIDTNRVYAEGNSFGANGCFFFSLLHPEMIAAIDVTGGIFNFGFGTDYNPDCTMNVGQKNRNDGDLKYGTTSYDLPVGGTGLGVYDLLNAGWMIHQFQDKKYPVIYSMNGRNDDAMGWTEKPIWYDSVNNNHLGGYFFFDNRDHSGIGRFWSSTNYDMFRYYRNVSYPAFSNCSVNSNAGDGHSTNGDSVGSINGFLDWKSTAADITDLPTQWTIRINMRDLHQQFGGITFSPDSCIADITLRRLQQFNPAVGNQLSWTVTHKGTQAQSGILNYNGGLITVPGVKIYKDTIVFSITSAVLNTYYQDLDNDGYGNAMVSISAVATPLGYVVNNTDCNDNNAAIHPQATDSCNGIDDDCNGVTDDFAFTATISAGSATTICSGGSVVLTASPSGANYTYQWMNNIINIAGATSASYTANATGSYSVAITNSGVCSFTSNSIPVTVNTSPVPTITPSGTISACNSTKVKLNASTESYYQWYLNGTAISGATKSTYSSNGTEGGDYKVLETNTSGCSAYSTATTINRIAPPSAKIKVTGSLDICATGSVLLKEKNGIGPYWQWNKNGSAISGATLKNYTATSTGDYTVTVTNSDGCSKTSGKTTVTSSCRDANVSSMDQVMIDISPNPASDFVQINIHLGEVANGNVQMKLLNLLGQPILSQNLTVDGNELNSKISTKGIPDGMYIFQFSINGEFMIRQVVIKN